MSDGEDPVAWLRAQVEARKSAAGALAAVLGGHWLVRLNDDDDFDFTVRAADIDVEPASDAWRRDAADHIAANDPRDTIARCEAELAILDEHGPDDTFGPDDLCCCACGDRPQVPFPCRTVRILLGAYQHRTGFKAEWLP